MLIALRGDGLYLAPNDLSQYKVPDGVPVTIGGGGDTASGAAQALLDVLEPDALVVRCVRATCAIRTDCGGDVILARVSPVMAEILSDVTP